MHIICFQNTNPPSFHDTHIVLYMQPCSLRLWHNLGSLYDYLASLTLQPSQITAQINTVWDERRNDLVHGGTVSWFNRVMYPASQCYCPRAVSPFWRGTSLPTTEFLSKREWKVVFAITKVLGLFQWRTPPPLPNPRTHYPHISPQLCPPPPCPSHDPWNRRPKGSSQAWRDYPLLLMVLIASWNASVQTVTLRSPNSLQDHLQPRNKLPHWQHRPTKVITMPIKSTSQHLHHFQFIYLIAFRLFISIALSNSIANLLASPSICYLLVHDFAGWGISPSGCYFNRHLPHEFFCSHVLCNSQVLCNCQVGQHSMCSHPTTYIQRNQDRFDSYKNMVVVTWFDISCW